MAAAAQSGDIATKIRLLQGAAAIDPNSEEAKLALLEAAYRAKRYQNVVAAVYPLIARGGINVPPEPEPQPGARDQATEDQPDNQWVADQFLSGAVPYLRHRAQPAPVDPARRAAIARQLADSFAKLNMSREAVFYYRIALRLQPSDSESKTQVNLFQAQLEQRRANRQRQPVITAGLEQDHPVRPRLTNAAGASGGGQ